MKRKNLSRIVISFWLLIFGCKNKTEVNIPFNFKQKNSLNIDFKIDTISNKKVYNILLSKWFMISMEEKKIGFTKVIYKKPFINYNLIQNAIGTPKREEINEKFSFYAIIKINESRFEKIPIKLSNITISDYNIPIKEN